MELKTLSPKISLSFMLVFGFCMMQTIGYFDPEFIVAFTLCFGALVYGFFKKPTSSTAENLKPLYYLIAIVFTLLLYLRPAQVHADKTQIFNLTMNLLRITFFGILFWGVTVIGNLENPMLLKKWEPRILLGLICLLLSAYLSILGAFPDPHIDVHSISTEAADFLLQGKNPYAQTYQDIYQGKMGYPPYFPYLPAVFLWQLPARFFYLDIRVSFFIGLIGTLFFFFWASKEKGLSSSTGLLFSYLWLSVPSGIYIFEQSFIDNALCFWLGASILAWLHSSYLWMGVTLGLLIATKQYAVFVPLFFLATLFFQGKRKEALRCGLTMTAVACLFILPFFILSPEGFLHNTIEVLLDIPTRLDSFTWVAFSQNVWGVSFPGILSLGLTLLGVALGIYRASQRPGLISALEGLIISYGVTFLVGKQAFCNYYYFFFVFVVWRELLLSSERKIP